MDDAKTRRLAERIAEDRRRAARAPDQGPEAGLRHRHRGAVDGRPARGEGLLHGVRHARGARGHGEGAQERDRHHPLRGRSADRPAPHPEPRVHRRRAAGERAADRRPGGSRQAEGRGAGPRPRGRPVGRRPGPVQEASRDDWDEGEDDEDDEDADRCRARSTPATGRPRGQEHRGRPDSSSSTSRAA